MINLYITSSKTQSWTLLYSTVQFEIGTHFGSYTPAVHSSPYPIDAPEMQRHCKGKTDLASFLKSHQLHGVAQPMHLTKLQLNSMFDSKDSCITYIEPFVSVRSSRLQNYRMVLWHYSHLAY